MLQVLAMWHSRDITSKTEDSHVDTAIQDESNSENTDTEQQPTVAEDALSLFESIDKALIKVRKHVYECSLTLKILLSDFTNDLNFIIPCMQMQDNSTVVLYYIFIIYHYKNVSYSSKLIYV